MANEIITPSNEQQLLIGVLTKIIQNAQGRIVRRSKRIDELEKYLFTYSLMSDDYSRSLYARILSRMLAEEFLDVNIAVSAFPIWSEEFVTEYDAKKKTVVLPDLKHPNDLASRIIFPETFYMPAYEYRDICTVKENETVFDIGAWIGDTAYVFSQRMRGTGKIYAFEPMPQNFKMLTENAAKIPNLIINNIALGKENGVLKFSFGGDNSGASRQNDNGTFEVKVTTVDCYVRENNIDRVDLIKADIEGAECDMLLGAAETIKRFHPKLAICIYHRGQTDHYAVPEIILSIRQDYEFYVEAYQNGLYETVLFAVPIDYIPERKDVCVDIDVIKGMYIAVHDKFSGDFQSGFFKEFNHSLDTYLTCHFDWQVNDNKQKFFLKTNGNFHYKVFLLRPCITVELVFDNFNSYSNEHRKCILDILDSFLKRQSGYRKFENQYGLFIRKEIPYRVATADNVACNMAVLIKETLVPLWENGLVDAECIKPLLYNGCSPSTLLSPPQR